MLRTLKIITEENHIIICTFSINLIGKENEEVEGLYNNGIETFSIQINSFEV